MDQDFSWLRTKQPNHQLTCSAYRVETGIELRTTYGPEDIVATQLFRGPDADEQVADRAEEWRETLIKKGFREPL